MNQFDKKCVKNRPKSMKCNRESGMSLMGVLALLSVVGVIAVSMSENFSAKLKTAKIAEKQNVITGFKDYFSLTGCGIEPSQNMGVRPVQEVDPETGDIISEWEEEIWEAPCSRATPASPIAVNVYGNSGEILVKMDESTYIAGYKFRAKCIGPTDYYIEIKPPWTTAWEKLFKDRNLQCN